MNISTGQDLQIFYTGDTGNNSPSFGGYQEIANIAEFPTIIQSSSVENIETYDSDYSSVLTGDKAIDAFPITVNYVIDEPSHKFLEQAAEQQTPIQVKVKYTSDEEANAESYIVLNGYVSSNNLTGDKDAVVQRSYLFTPETVVTQGFAAIQPLLRRSDYGLGSDGIDAPQYTPATGQIAGNGFIQIPAAATGNPASTNLIGVGLTNNKNEASIVMSETGDLKLYARNQNTAWTRIYTSTEQDTRYARLGQPANFGNLTITGTITSTGTVTVPGNQGLKTSPVSGASAALSSEQGYGIVWRNNEPFGTKANEWFGISPNSQLQFRQANDTTSGLWTVRNVYHEGFKPSKGDVGLSNVSNDSQLKIASNLNDLNNKAAARTNLDVYSRTETVNLVARYTVPPAPTGKTYMKFGNMRTSGNAAAYANFIFYGAGNYGGTGSNVDTIALSARSLGNATNATIGQWVKHVRVLQNTNAPLQIGMVLLEDQSWDIYLVSNGFWSGTSIEVNNVVGGSTATDFITGFLQSRTFGTWSTTVPTGIVTITPEDIVTSNSVIPITQGGTGATTAAAAATNLGLGATDTVTFKNIILTNTQDPTINLQQSIVRSNSANQMVLSAPAGIFIRPNGDADSTKQMRYNNDGTLVFSGTAITLNGSLAMNGGITSNNSITLTNASTDTAFTTNGFKMRATPAGVGVLSTINKAINIRPVSDTDATKAVVIDPATSLVNLTGMGLVVDNGSTFNANVTINNGLSLRAPMRIRPVNNTDWANIGFYDADNTTQRGAVFCDQAGTVGMMVKGGKFVSYAVDGSFNVSYGYLSVGQNISNSNGEGNDGFIKAQFFNKGWFELYGTNPYQENGNGQWVRQINGMRLIQKGSDNLNQQYMVTRTGTGNSGFVINQQGYGKQGWVEFRNDAHVTINGTDPTLEVGGAMFYADGNVSGSKWANQGGGQWNNYLSNWLGANGVSDQRYKENIKPTTRVALDTVDKIQFVDFDWSENMRGQKNTDSVTGGWISQELEKIDPSLVNHLFDGEFVNPDISTVLPLAFKAIQELSEKNKALEERLQKLEELMNK
ncbi:tail fiber domain-containing protein [Serratia nevei]|uniref:tail fiber domain-containing protein n=1 Tax=Serratia nevei TaxID=2703794 RepID=UPI003686AB45